MTPRDGTSLAVRSRAIAQSPAPPRSPTTRLAPDGTVTAVASSGSCLLLAAGPTGALRLVDLTDPDAPQRTLGMHGGPVQALVVSAAGAFSAGCDGRVLAWRLAPSLPVVVGAHRAGVTSAAVAPAGHLVAAGHDGYVLAWTGAVPETLGEHPGGVEAMCLLGSGVPVTAGRDGRLLCHEPSCLVELHQRRRELTTALLAVAPDVLASATGHCGAVRLWTEPATDPCPEELGIHGGWVLGLVSLGQDRLAAVGGGHVSVWDLRSGAHVRIRLRPGMHATGGVVLDTGDLVVASPDGRVEVIEAQRWAG